MGHRLTNASLQQKLATCGFGFDKTLFSFREDILKLNILLAFLRSSLKIFHHDAIHVFSSCLQNKHQLNSNRVDLRVFFPSERFIVSSVSQLKANFTPIDDRGALKLEINHCTRKEGNCISTLRSRQ